MKDNGYRDHIPVHSNSVAKCCCPEIYNDKLEAEERKQQKEKENEREKIQIKKIDNATARQVTFSVMLRNSQNPHSIVSVFLSESNIRAVDGNFHILRAFENLNIIHVDDTVDPVRDLEIIRNYA
ncbi:hypothetical protein ACFX2I_022180 [Malus domestica]